jgi:hypothetical protein
VAKKAEKKFNWTAYAKHIENQIANDKMTPEERKEIIVADTLKYYGVPEQDAVDFIEAFGYHRADRLCMEISEGITEGLLKLPSAYARKQVQTELRGRIK